MTPKLRYEALAKALLASDNPTKAIASLIGDHEARIDGLCDRLNAVEFRVHEMKSSPQNVEV